MKAFLLSLVLAGLGCIPAASFAQTPEEAVIAQVLAFNQAYEKNDLDAYFAFYTDDAMLWMGGNHVKLDDYKKDWYELIGKGGGVEKNTITEMNVQMGPGDSMAIVTYRVEVHTRMPDGTVNIDTADECDTWFLAAGQWRVGHIHYMVEPATE